MTTQTSTNNKNCCSIHIGFVKTFTLIFPHVAVVISPGSFKYIGCFKHPKSSSVVSQDYKILDGRPSTATFPNKKPNSKDYVIELCAQNSYARGYMFFGIHNREKCVSSAVFQDIYDDHGRAYDCLTTGTGGFQSMAVYTFTDRGKF